MATYKKKINKTTLCLQEVILSKHVCGCYLRSVSTYYLPVRCIICTEIV